MDGPIAPERDRQRLALSTGTGKSARPRRRLFSDFAVAFLLSRRQLCGALGQGWPVPCVDVSQPGAVALLVRQAYADYLYRASAGDLRRGPRDSMADYGICLNSKNEMHKGQRFQTAGPVLLLCLPKTNAWITHGTTPYRKQEHWAKAAEQTRESNIAQMPKKSTSVITDVLFGCGTRIRTQTGRVRDCSATLTQFRNISWSDIIIAYSGDLSSGSEGNLPQNIKNMQPVQMSWLKLVLITAR